MYLSLTSSLVNGQVSAIHFTHTFHQAPPTSPHSVFSKMARAKSKLAARYEASRSADLCIQAAVSLYTRSRDNALSNNSKVPSYAEIARACGVPKETLRRRLHNLPSHLDAAAGRGWLNAIESKQLINHLHDSADQGFPHGCKDIERHVLEIARIRHPGLSTLGPSWVDRFIARNFDQLHTQWTANLDHARAAGVNRTAIAHWFSLVEAAFQEYGFAPENVYGFDELGFPFGGDEL